jgi:hypothetical protein
MLFAQRFRRSESVGNDFNVNLVLKIDEDSPPKYLKAYNRQRSDNSMSLPVTAVTVFATAVII